MKTLKQVIVFFVLIGIIYSFRFDDGSNSLKMMRFQSTSDDRQNCPFSTFHYFFETNNRYVVTDHVVRTSDGYVLTAFRVNLSEAVQKELDDNSKKNLNRPVILAAGLASDADIWFYNGEEKSLGFHLVNQGFDVWVMNNRGTKYSREHENANISEKEYYNFSWQEMGIFDQPALYEKIIATYSKEKNIADVKILYYGHSQGGGQLFAGLSDANSKHILHKYTERFFAIAPAVFSVTKKTAKFDTNWHQIYPGGCSTYSSYYRFLQRRCNIFVEACDDYMEKKTSVDPKVDNVHEYWAQWKEHTPSSTSSKDVVHFSQVPKGDPSSSNKDEPFFGYFNYGSEEENMKYYKQKYPPAFDIGSISVPITIIYFGKDKVVTPNMTILLQSKLVGSVVDTH